MTKENNSVLRINKGNLDDFINGFSSSYRIFFPGDILVDENVIDNYQNAFRTSAGKYGIGLSAVTYMATFIPVIIKISSL